MNAVALPERAIISFNTSRPMHQDHIRDGRAAVMPGNWQRHDPFLSMMNDKFKRGAFGPHPHRGFETVTYVISGQLRHEDNKGGSGLRGPGDTQWMTAGRGVVHNEIPANDDFVHVLQLWLNLPASEKLVPSGYQDLRADDLPIRYDPGVEVRVISGTSGNVTGPARNHVPVTMLDVRLDAGAHFVQELPGGDNGFLYVLDGEGTFGSNEAPASSDTTLWMERHEDRSVIRMTATTDMQVILFSGRPLGEPVVAHGPFVMNSQQEIREAFDDYHSGGFGPETAMTV